MDDGGGEPTVGVITQAAAKNPETAVGAPSGAPNEAWPASGRGDYGVSGSGELFAGEGGDGESG